MRRRLSLYKAVGFIPGDPEQTSLGEARRVRAEIDLGRAELFPKGYQDWARTPLGLSWQSSGLDSQDQDWKRSLRFEIPIFDRTQPLVHRFQLEIPALGSPPVAIELRCAGTRLLFAQLPGEPVIVIPDPPGDLKAALKAALKIRRQDKRQLKWFLLPGLRYEIRVALGPVQAGRRSVVLEVDNRRVLDKRTRVKERPQAKTMAELRSLGPVLLSRFDVTGTLRL